MRYWHHFVSLIAVMTIVIAITAAFVHFRSGKGRKLPVYWVVPNFQLIAHDKKPFGLKDLKGKIWGVEFFFASCAGI